MNTTPTAGSPAQHRRVPGTNPWQGASMVLSVALAGGSATADARPRAKRHVASADDRFNAATTLYERGQWNSAFETLGRLADEGHALASKLALLMLRYGAPLYGTRFEASPGQVARWAGQVLAAKPLS